MRSRTAAKSSLSRRHLGGARELFLFIHTFLIPRQVKEGVVEIVGKTFASFLIIMLHGRNPEWFFFDFFFASPPMTTEGNPFTC